MKVAKTDAFSRDMRPIIKHPASDQYWRKYAQKRLKGHEDNRTNVVRYYYRCTAKDCPAKKTVEKEPWDPLDMAQLRFSEQHNHPITHPSQEIPSRNKALSAPQLMVGGGNDNSIHSLMAADPRMMSNDPSRPLSLLTEQHFAFEVQTSITCVLQTICTTLAWPLCQLWIPDFQKAHLSRFKCALNVQDTRALIFQEQALGLALPLDPKQDSVSLPCRVWYSTQPELMQDLRMSQQDKSPLHKLAREVGMCSAAAFPMTLDGQLAGVIAMFSPTEVRLLDADVNFLITALSTMALALVALYSRLSKQAPAQVKELLPAVLHYINAIFKCSHT